VCASTSALWSCSSNWTFAGSVWLGRAIFSAWWARLLCPIEFVPIWLCAVLLRWADSMKKEPFGQQICSAHFQITEINRNRYMNWKKKMNAKLTFLSVSALFARSKFMLAVWNLSISRLALSRAFWLASMDLGGFVSIEALIKTKR
jgi:hypothetical protein